jgi:nitroreductase
MKTSTRALVAASLAVFFLSGALPAFAADSIQLPAPKTEGGKPLLQALKDRSSARAFSDRKLSDQTLSDLLWAAFGINRPDGRRTAPSAKNWQEIDIYVATPDGFFLWDPHKNALDMVAAGDHRAMAGTQPFVKDAAVNLVYVANMSKVDGGKTDNAPWVWSDAGFIAQNVYLFCASEGLATVVRAGVDREALTKELKLKPEQVITLAQSVGYPK